MDTTYELYNISEEGAALIRNALRAAPINNPDFTGVPTAPTASPGTDNNQIATTSFVVALVGSQSLIGLSDTPGSYTGQSGKALVVNGAESGIEFVTVGTGDLLAANNLSDLTDPAQARINLGLQIGVNVQPYNAGLSSWASKTVPSGTVVGNTDSQILTNKTLSAGTVITSVQFSGQVRFTPFPLVDGATISWDMADGNLMQVTVAGNRLLENPINAKAGTYLLIITQDPVGGRSITLDTQYKVPSGTAPIFNQEPNGVTVITVIVPFDGATALPTIVQSFES